MARPPVQATAEPIPPPQTAQRPATAPPHQTATGAAAPVQAARQMPAAPAVTAVARPGAAPQTSTGVCLIRAGVFSQRANADNLAKILKPLGEVRVNAMQLDGKLVHLVTVAGLGTRKNAELALARLKATTKDLGALKISGCQA